MFNLSVSVTPGLTGQIADISLVSVTGALSGVSGPVYKVQGSSPGPVRCLFDLLTFQSHNSPTNCR